MYIIRSACDSMNHATCSIWYLTLAVRYSCLVTTSAWHPCELLTSARDSVTQADVPPNISGFAWLSYYSSEWYWPVITTELFHSHNQTARLSSLRFPSDPRLCVAGFKGIRSSRLRYSFVHKFNFYCSEFTEDSSSYLYRSFIFPNTTSSLQGWGLNVCFTFTCLRLLLTR